MKTKRKRIGMLAFIVMIAVLMIVTMQTPGTIADSENYQCQTYATVFALLPPVIAIGLALITKEVYTSLLAGIIAGGLLYSNFNLELMLNTIFYQGEGGMVMKLSDSWNVGILVFLVMLGILVALLNKAGGSAAFGEWTTKHIKTRVGAQIAVIALGVMIFVFIQTIPYNLYAILTLCMLLAVTILKVDFGPMKKHEMNAFKGDLFTTPGRPYESDEEAISNDKAHVMDLVLPVAVLIVSCIVAMIYTGGFFDGASFVDAFADSDASVGLVLGGSVALVFTFIYFMMRDVLSFKEFTDCIPEGFKAMVAPILILSMAWTLSGMTNLLGAKIFVAELVAGSALSMQGFLPMIIFLVAAFLAFATGTSWGTFSILIPIVIGVFPEGQMMVISIASCLAGAVCGDHCSPISDTTIMASAGAHCEHVNHVSTQLPYVLLVAAVCMVGYFLIGVFRAVGLASIAWLALPICIIILLAILLIIRAKGTKEAA